MKRLIDFEKARKSVMKILAGKVTTPTAVKVALAMQEATVDAVEVVHGRWITVGTGITERVVCSVCSSQKCGYLKQPYCPNCGARMNEKDDES